MSSPPKRQADAVPRELLLLGPGRVALCPFEPPPMTAHSVLLKTLFSGISHGTEMLFYRGDAPKFHHTWDDGLRHFVPRASELNGDLPMGYESVARVQEVGSDVEGFSPGEMIWLDAPHREVHVIDSRQPPPFWRLDDDADPQSLAFLALARVALGAVHDAEPVLGGSAAVCGLGTVGQLCAQLLLRAGVRHVFGIDPDPHRLAVAARSGVITAPADGSDPAAFIKETMPGVDVGIEASGRYAGLASLLRCVAPMGRVVVVSSYGSQSEGIVLGHEFHRNRISLISSMTVNGCAHPKAPLWTFERLTAEAATLLTEHSLSVSPMVTSVPFASAPDAYRMLAQDPVPPLKIVFAYE
jgi:threonine dehydrogenase-like Zn-dependent dehydrogenase